MQRLQVASQRVGQRLGVRLRRARSMGITGRLTLAFAAVAIFAVAANVVVEHGVQVVRSTHLERSLYSPVPEAIGVRRIVVPPVLPAAGRRVSGEAEIRRFVSAVDRVQSSTEIRAATESADSEAELSASSKELSAAAADLRSVLPRPSLRPEMDEALLAFREAGAGYVQRSDARRSAAREYLARLDDLDARITVSINAGWKFFGRVLARESLLTVHSDIESLRRLFGGIGDPEQVAAALPEAAASELSLRKAYDASEPGLLKSEGADWVRQTRDDFARMAALRDSVLATAAQILEDRLRLASSKARLSAFASAARAASAAADAAVSASTWASTSAAASAAVSVSASAASAGEATTLLRQMAAPRSSPVPAAITTTTTETLPDRERRITVACITAAVLALLSAISIWTVRSIMVPVGRILEATRKLASGDVEVRVPRGGMKELDSLAAAFNRMAVQLATARDITLDYRRHLESQVEQRTRQLQHLAERDPLTLLANRRRFFVLLNQSMQRAREIECGIAIFFIDIDNFKNLNDGMGHGFGDRALISVAQRLEETAASFGFAARLGGDEFTVVHEKIFSREDAREAGLELVEAFRRPLAVEGREITLSVSIGASLYPDHEQCAENLLSAADAALFRAKGLGRNQLAMFTPELLEAATRKFTTEQGVRHALEHDEFELVYQPEVSMDSLEVGLVEALVRWRLPDGRLAGPDEFLGVTEESGLIVELGDWVLRNALQAASNWHRGRWPQVKVAINVSARQLIDQRFVPRIQQLLAEFALPPTCIELELTESVLQTGSSTIESLRLLRSLGIAIALDDFGTGYSSISSLEQLPLSRIKLDRSLIGGIDSNPRSAAIALALIRLCDELDIDVTAEGVESESQFACLAENRAMYLQGYLLSRPVAETEVLRVNQRMPQVMHDLMLTRPSAESSPKAARRVKIPIHG